MRYFGVATLAYLILFATTHECRPDGVAEASALPASQDQGTASSEQRHVPAGRHDALVRRMQDNTFHQQPNPKLGAKNIWGVQLVNMGKKSPKQQSTLDPEIEPVEGDKKALEEAQERGRTRKKPSFWRKRKTWVKRKEASTTGKEVVTTGEKTVSIKRFLKICLITACGLVLDLSTEAHIAQILRQSDLASVFLRGNRAAPAISCAPSPVEPSSSSSSWGIQNTPFGRLAMSMDAGQLTRAVTKPRKIASPQCRSILERLPPLQEVISKMRKGYAPEGQDKKKQMGLRKMIGPGPESQDKKEETGKRRQIRLKPPKQLQPT